MIRWLVVPLALVAAGGTAPEPAPRTHTVEMRGMAFVPESLTVAVGDTLVWINRDIVPHTATAEAPPRWDTGLLSKDQSGRYVPRQPGAFAYLCAFHPTMRGALIVKEPL